MATENDQTRGGDFAVIIDEEGGISFIHDDEAAEALRECLGRQHTVRASHVEPTDDGRWSVDVAPILKSAAPVILGIYPTRKEALAAEVDWLLGHMMGG
jgi:hypothetical protein